MKNTILLLQCDCDDNFFFKFSDWTGSIINRFEIRIKSKLLFNNINNTKQRSHVNFWTNKQSLVDTMEFVNSFLHCQAYTTHKYTCDIA